MAASFNATGSGGKPAIIPTSDGRLAAAVVLTRPAEAQPRREEFTFPGVSGSGSIDFGLESAEIIWEWRLEAASIANLQAFENDLRSYRGAGRYTLVSERSGESWDNVEYVAYEPEPLEPLVGGGWLRSGRVRFAWMQPGP